MTRRPFSGFSWFHCHWGRIAGAVVGLEFLLGGCAVPIAPACSPVAARTGAVAWLVDQGWHTEIGLAADELTGPLGVFRTTFPGARVLMFGFGKRTFITARVTSLSELLLGPVPGPGAIEVVGLRVRPQDAYASPVEMVTLPIGGAARLSAFLWAAIGKDRAGGARLIAPGLFPGSLFYAASRRYSLTYTCNTWTADALAAAGVPMAADGVILPGSLMRQTAGLAGICRAEPG